MRSAILALLLCSLFVLGQSQKTAQFGATTASKSSALKDAIVSLEKESWVAWKNRDGGYFAKFLSDDHVELGQQGPAGKADVVAFVGDKACVVNSYSLDKFNLTQITADTALLTYHATQDTQCNGHPVPSPAWASSLYVNRNGKWLNVLYQQTFTK
jgi:hypothetical protein